MTQKNTNPKETKMETVAAALRNKIEAIESGPLAWAKDAEKELLATLGTAAQYAMRATDEELLENAARQLKKATAMLAEEDAKAKPEPVDMARLVRANERTKTELESENS